jgi:choline dehydrogenase-like flavoprotein
MKKAVVIGSGAGGATAAKELQGRYDVTVLEAGGAFEPFAMPLLAMEKLKKTGLFFDEREIQLLFPAMKIRKTRDRMVLVNGIGTGGTTTLSAGNALRMDSDLQQLGINLDAEFEEIYQEIHVTDGHRQIWRNTTKRLFEICAEMGLDPKPTPKMGDYQRCTGCGQCVLGCQNGVKWDSRKYLKIAVDHGARLVTGCRADRIAIKNGRVVGVQAHAGLHTVFYPADMVILAAGGLATPVILRQSGIECSSSLFVDPVLCVAAEWKDCLQNSEISMPFVVQKEHYILSPYFDHLSFFFNRSWKHPARDTLSLMIKLKDETIGGIKGGMIEKVLTELDKERLHAGVGICTEILGRMGADQSKLFLGTINAGHPGGMLPLTRSEAETFHNPRLPENLYVADATLFPASLGNPPILTIIAMAKRVCRTVSER